MRDALVGWLGLTVFVVAVLVTVAADFFRQSDTAGATREAHRHRRPMRRVFWLTVVSLVLAGLATIATVVRLATLA
jgi:heme/copper-type cytochrome/quinol oxidase subunit 2